jgi:hypothetical protein
MEEIMKKKISERYNWKFFGPEELDTYLNKNDDLGSWLQQNCLDMSKGIKEPGHTKYLLLPSTLIDFESESQSGRDKGLFSLIIEKEPKPVSAEIDLVIQRYENLPEELRDLLKGFRYYRSGNTIRVLTFD